MRTVLAALVAAVAAISVGCAGGQKQETTPEQKEQTAAKALPAPRMGVVSSVDGERLMITDPTKPTAEPQLFERTTESIVVREGRTVSWSDLKPGENVRVAYDEGIFGPDRAVRVEIVPQEAMPSAEPQPVVPEQPGATPSEMGPRPVTPAQPSQP